MVSTGRTLSDLAACLPDARLGSSTSGSALVTDVTHDSRQVSQGCLFVAVRGTNFDGHRFVAAAVEAGASALCVDHEMGTQVDELVVGDTRAALGQLASMVHGDPSRRMKVIGVTGTNGKTTVAHFIDSMGRELGFQTGLIGTIETRIGNESVQSAHTTPEASDFQRLLAQMEGRDTELVAVEVSSHALEMGRVNATTFSVAAFTNLSQDHLDFHGSMDDYRQAKWRLFDEFSIGHAVFNTDDETGKVFAEAYEGPKTTIGAEGDVRVSSLSSLGSSTQFELSTPWGSASITAPVVGRFNVDNAVAAATCLLVSGSEFEHVVEALQNLERVPGRFELISGSDPIRVVVDYAHTPAGITEAIEAARLLNPKRVIALVGAGGDRDRGKRPLMGAAVAEADVAVVTSDNPRSEDPTEIVNEVVSGLDLRTEVIVEVDRGLGIQRALESASDGDVVLILGRGHETSQDLGGRRVSFDDREAARSALNRLRRSNESGSGSGSMGL